MKLPALVLALLTATGAFAAPQLPVEKAVSIASKHLKERGNSGGAYITSIKLEPDTVQRSSFRWNVTWNEPIALDELKKEVGVVIAMDGSLVSLVKGPPNRDPMTGKYDPNGPTGLQNPRTRTDRPSILDLKR
jgi:hypothetical protein